MHEVSKNLWVGSQHDLTNLPEDWSVVHAAKEPWHREAVGYTTQGAPVQHPEYLVALRGNRLCLNLVDADDPKFIHSGVMRQAINFIAEQLALDTQVLVHCNQGGSRGPGVAMAYLAPQLDREFEAAEQTFIKLYPNYAPHPGMRGWLRSNW